MAKATAKKAGKLSQPQTAHAVKGFVRLVNEKEEEISLPVAAWENLPESEREKWQVKAPAELNDN